MKTIRNYICLFLLLSGYGCNDFLEETSLTLVYPSDLNDLEQLFVGEAYRTEAINNTYDYYHLLCDNYEHPPPLLSRQLRCVIHGTPFRGIFMGI